MYHGDIAFFFVVASVGSECKVAAGVLSAPWGLRIIRTVCVRHGALNHRRVSGTAGRDGLHTTNGATDGWFDGFGSDRRKMEDGVGRFRRYSLTYPGAR